MKNTPFVRVLANQVHVCTGCGEPIEIGDEYIRWLASTGRWGIEKRHVECMEDIRHMTDESPINSNE